MNELYHEGEVRMQELAGERDAAIMNGRIVRDRIPPGARSFLRAQEVAVLGWTSPSGEVWASFVTGPPGFVAASDDLGALDVEIVNDTGVLAGAPVAESLAVGDPLGALLIDLATRRRLRVNGAVASLDGPRLRLRVEAAYANCPKYIQEREVVAVAPSAPAASVIRGVALNEDLARWIERADTLFVASRSAAGRMDASHRGGSPGFVRVQDGALVIPDYPGNGMFNTLGNLLVDPRAGLVFVDFEAGLTLALTGEAAIDLGRPADDDGTGGTGRRWRFTPKRWAIAPLNVPFSFRFVRASPYNP
jgi:predicted pyridoxine 5'-phosphate oxidase superfamily flavin-nucleotide-binding protein